MANSKKGKAAPKKRTRTTKADVEKQLKAKELECDTLEQANKRLCTENRKFENESALLRLPIEKLRLESQMQSTNANRARFQDNAPNFHGNHGINGWNFGYDCKALAQSQLMLQMLAPNASHKDKPQRSSIGMRDGDGSDESDGDLSDVDSEQTGALELPPPPAAEDDGLPGRQAQYQNKKVDTEASGASWRHGESERKEMGRALGDGIRGREARSGGRAGGGRRVRGGSSALQRDSTARDEDEDE